MIWKIVVLLSVVHFAHQVQSEEDAVSEQRVVIHHQKSSRDGSISQKKSGNQEEYDAHAYPSYEFSYNVNDPKTHDIKGQHEKREGGEVTGNYWLVEPSGRKRTVNYQANDDDGFNAQILYTASLKGEDKNEEVSVSQGQDIKEDNSEKNNQEGVEITIDERNQENNDASGDSVVEPAPVVENNLSEQSESDNQEDEANNISNIENPNVDRNDDENVVQSNQKVENTNNNRENNERNSGKGRRGNTTNNTEQDKREKLKKNKNQNRVPSRTNNESNKNNYDRPSNDKRVKQNGRQRNENNNKNKGKKSNRNKNLHDSNDDNKQMPHNKNYAYINFSPNGEIQRKTDIPDNGETFEHRIRIYHPKNIYNS